MRTACAIEEFCPDEFVVNVEQAVLVDRHSELRPDVVLVRVDDGGDRSPVRPVDVALVVEVLSKSSRSYDRGAKLKRYAEIGIPACWIIDPLVPQVTFTQFALEPDGSHHVLLQTDERVTIDEPWKITLDLPAWTRRRDRIRGTAPGT